MHVTRTFDDPAFSSLWALENTGQMIGGQLGTPGDDIDAVTAWDKSEGAGVTVAVVDTGIASTHVDLADQIATNAAEAGGALGVDDDHNGLVDDVNGWDFVDHDAVPQDGQGHGTHVSGTIVAEGQNTFGVVGVAPLAKVLPLRVLDNGGTGWASDIANAFAYAGDQGVRIVNASLGGGRSDAIEDAIAEHPNTLYVVAAGNDGADADTDGDAFPCALPQANLICVGASDNRDQVAGFSNYGDTAVDLFAPGVRIYSTLKDGVLRLQGRHLDGVAARRGRRRARAVARPGASTAFLRYALLHSVDTKPGWGTWSVTGGRLNASGAVTTIGGPEPSPTPTPTPEPPVETPTPEPPAPPPVAPVPTPDPVTAPALTLTQLEGQRLAARQREQAARRLPPLARRLGALHGAAEGLADRVRHLDQARPGRAATRC